MKAYLDYAREGRLQLGDQINEACNAAYQRATEYAQATLRTLTVANAGSIALLVALTGHLANSSSCSVQTVASHLEVPAIAFSIGLVMVMVSFVASFLNLQLGAQSYANLGSVSDWVMSDPAKQQTLTIQKGRPALVWLFRMAFVGAIASMLAFIGGTAATILAVEAMPC